MKLIPIHREISTWGYTGLDITHRGINYYYREEHGFDMEHFMMELFWEIDQYGIEFVYSKTGATGYYLS